MRKHFLILFKGLVFGFLGGILISGLALALFRAMHDLPDPAQSKVITVYFLSIGTLLGLLAGWLGGLNALLWHLLHPLLWKTAGILPATAERIDSLWLGRLDALMAKALDQTKGIVRWVLLRIFMPRLRSGVDSFNLAVEKYRLGKPGRVLTSQMMSFAALCKFLEPIWIFFYVAYSLVALGFLVFLGVPFIR